MDVRPDLVDLGWAKGAEPTPHGLLKVDAHKIGDGVEVAVDMPEGVVARVSVPVASSATQVSVNGKTQRSATAENGTRMIVTLSHAGHYSITGR